jgi:DNA end-binding protein Ku
MRETGRAALARYAARGKQYLVILRPSSDGRALILQELLYADEVRALSDVPLPEGEAREAELKLAKQLIDQIATETFEPTKYRDEVRERIQADIERKVQGHDISESAPAPEPARIIDLMAALKASLGKGAAAPAAKADHGHKAADEGGEAEAHHPRRGARRSEDAAAAEPKRAKKR